MCCCHGAGTIVQRGAVFFRSYMNLYSQRLGGDPKHMSSTQPGGGLNLYKLWLLKLMNLPRSFLLRKQSVRFALAVISSMCRFHLRFVENHTSR